MAMSNASSSYCEVAHPPGTSTSTLFEIVREQGLAIKALQKAIGAPAPAGELRDLAAANERIAAQLADNARAITQQAGVMGRQGSEIASLQHDVAVGEAVIFGLVCVLVVILAVLSKRKSAKPQSLAPTADDIISNLLKSTRSRS
jgi:hypothetical protein